MLLDFIEILSHVHNNSDRLLYIKTTQRFIDLLEVRTGLGKAVVFVVSVYYNKAKVNNIIDKAHRTESRRDPVQASNCPFRLE